MTPRATAERIKAIERDAEKKAIETATYVIPIAAFTSMVHTVSGIMLHRLRRMASSRRHAGEARAGDRARWCGWSGACDPLFFEKVGCEELPTRTSCPKRRFPRPHASGDAFARQFDARLNGRCLELRDARRTAQRRWSPTRFARSSVFRRRDCRTMKRSTG